MRNAEDIEQIEEEQSKHRFCACGCGKEANHGKWYIGHWNKGRKRSDVTLRNNQNNPMKSADAREKSSITHKKLYIDSENHPRHGLTHNEETKEVISKKKKEFYKTKEGASLIEKLSNIHKGKHRSPNTEIPTGQHVSIETEFKKGHIPWSTGKKGLIVGYKFPKGDAHPLWKNGASFEPYCPKFNEPFKESVRETFGRVCFLCSKSEEENGRKLSIHHVNYNKNCLCDNTKCEFVPLCTFCHGKTNFNQDCWENLLLAKLRKRKLSHTQTVLDVFF